MSVQVFKAVFALYAPCNFKREALYHSRFLFCNLDLFHSENEDYPVALFETPMSDGDPDMAQDAQYFDVSNQYKVF